MLRDDLRCGEVWDGIYAGNQLGIILGMAEKKNESKNKVVPVGTAIERDIAGPVPLWLSASFAEDWFRDVCREAELDNDRNARRREN